MFDRTNARVIRPATGTERTAKSWLTLLPQMPKS